MKHELLNADQLLVGGSAKIAVTLTRAEDEDSDEEEEKPKNAPINLEPVYAPYLRTWCTVEPKNSARKLNLIVGLMWNTCSNKGGKKF